MDEPKDKQSKESPPQNEVNLNNLSFTSSAQEFLTKKNEAEQKFIREEAMDIMEDHYRTNVKDILGQY